MIGRIVDLEKALRPMVERSGLASDSLQLLAKAAEVAGSEDGLEGVTDSAQELQLRLAEVVQDGTGPAGEAFKKLGISAQDLIDKSPEDMLLTVVAALQNVTNEADRKFLADELLGGSSEKLAGLLNLTNEELADQLQHLGDTGDFMSRDALDAAKEYSGGMDQLKSSVSGVSTFIGTILIKELNKWISEIKKTVDGIKQLGRWLGITKDDTNEFTEAADEMAEVLGDGTAPAIVITTEAAEEAALAVQEVGDQAAIATPKVRTLTEATDEAAASVKLWAAANRASSQQMIEDSALRLSNLLTDYGKDVAAQGQVIADKEQMLDDFLQAEIDKWTNHYQIQADLRAADLQDYIAGLAAAKDAGDDGDGGGGRPPPGQGTDRRTRWVNGRPPDNSRDTGSGAIVNARMLGTTPFYATAFDPRTEYNANTFGRRAEVLAWLRSNKPELGDAIPAAQHGAAVRGSRYGSLVRVGENFTNENIVPVSRGGGMGGMGGGSRPIRLNLRLGRKRVRGRVGWYC